MRSTTARIAAELQYAGRRTFSSALKKLEAVERRIINGAVNGVYKILVKNDPQINKTDVLQLFASIGAFTALQDPDYAGSS